MSETIQRRHEAPNIAQPAGQDIEALPCDLRVALDLHGGTWCGDFNADRLGFGHLRARALPPPAGSLGLRAGSLQLTFVCDGFARGSLAQPDTRGWALLGSMGLHDLPPKQAGRVPLRRVPLELLHRPSYTWRTIDRSGQSPELQLAVARVRLTDLAWREGQGVEVFAVLHTARGPVYFNLDGVPRRNFVVAAELLRAEPNPAFPAPAQNAYPN